VQGVAGTEPAMHRCLVTDSYYYYYYYYFFIIIINIIIINEYYCNSAVESKKTSRALNNRKNKTNDSVTQDKNRSQTVS